MTPSDYYYCKSHETLALLNKLIHLSRLLLLLTLTTTINQPTEVPDIEHFNSIIYLITEINPKCNNEYPTHSHDIT